MRNLREQREFLIKRAMPFDAEFNAAFAHAITKQHGKIDRLFALIDRNFERDFFRNDKLLIDLGFLIEMQGSIARTQIDLVFKSAAR